MCGYVECKNTQESKIQMYEKYTKNSGFPYSIQVQEYENIKSYLESLIDTIIVKDIMLRKEFSNNGLFKKVLSFLLGNIGSIVSANKITNTLVSNGKKVSVNTIESYLEALNESFVMYKVSRYDIKGKEYLRNNAKYYVTDVGLRYAFLGTKDLDDGHILENVVYLELLRRGYEVYIGKINNYEVDFVAIKQGLIEYFQVSYSIIEQSTLERELKSLQCIHDNYPKTILTMDNVGEADYDGIKRKNVLNWLLEE